MRKNKKIRKKNSERINKETKGMKTEKKKDEILKRKKEKRIE